MDSSKSDARANPAAGTHPDLDALSEFLNGRLDEASSIAIETHLNSCPACCQSLADVAGRKDPLLA